MLEVMSLRNQEFLTLEYKPHRFSTTFASCPSMESMLRLPMHQGNKIESEFIWRVHICVYCIYMTPFLLILFSTNTMMKPHAFHSGFLSQYTKSWTCPCKTKATMYSRSELQSRNSVYKFLAPLWCWQSGNAEIEQNHYNQWSLAGKRSPAL